ELRPQVGGAVQVPVRLQPRERRLDVRTLLQQPRLLPLELPAGLLLLALPLPLGPDTFLLLLNLGQMVRGQPQFLDADLPILPADPDVHRLAEPFDRLRALVEPV